MTNYYRREFRKIEPETRERMERIMSHLGWSRRGLARVLSCNDATVNRWLKGKTGLPIVFAEWLAHAETFLDERPVPKCGRAANQARHRAAKVERVKVIVKPRTASVFPAFRGESTWRP